MATDSSAHAVTRIYEVICGGAGGTHALPAALRFSRGYPPGFTASLRATRARETVNGVATAGAAFVVLGAASTERFASGEMSDAHLYRVRVAIYRDHWLGYEGDAQQIEREIARSTDAFFALRAVLCFPGNLATTAAANDTGLAGAALNGAGASTRLVSVDNLGDRARLLQFRDDYEAELDVSPAGLLARYDP